MRWDRQRLIIVSFIVLSLGSAAYLSVITLNYLNYYPALGTLAAHIDSVSVVPGSNYSRIDTRITVSNPSGYTGIVLSEASTSMFFDNESNATFLFTDFPVTGDQTIGVHLAPHSTIGQDVVTRLYPSDASSLMSFASQRNGIAANVTLTVLLTTFLASSVGQYSLIVNSLVPLAG